MTKDLPATDSTLSPIDKFLASVTRKPSSARGSLIFAVDATGSREATWDLAADLQSRMFRETATIGPLDVKLIYFRGASQLDAECRASGWMSDPMLLATYMAGVKCRAGITQIGRTLDHAIGEAGQCKIGALVYIGDSCEEFHAELMPKARLLAELGVPIFVFQEGCNSQAEAVFREFAQITRGAYQRFDGSSARQLGELLRAVAAFAVGGVIALERQGSAAAKLLLGQVR